MQYTRSPRIVYNGPGGFNSIMKYRQPYKHALHTPLICPPGVKLRKRSSDVAVMTPSIVHNALHSTRSCHLPPIPCSAVSPHWLFRGHSFDDAFGHYHVALAIPSPFRISTSSSAATSQPPYSFGRVVGHVEVYGQKQWRGIILYNLYTFST